MQIVADRMADLPGRHAGWKAHLALETPAETVAGKGLFLAWFGGPLQTKIVYDDAGDIREMQVIRKDTDYAFRVLVHVATGDGI